MKVGTPQDPCVAKAPAAASYGAVATNGGARQRTAAQPRYACSPLSRACRRSAAALSGSMSALPRQTILIAAEVYS
jgi:hypothetical protein